MNVHNGKCFFDTNLLVYSWANNDKEKTAIARFLIDQKVKEKAAVLSTQVLQEFYSVVTTKMGCDKIIAKEVMLRFAQNNLIQIDVALLQQAIDISILSQVSFWDALIIAAAVHANCKVIYSEDLNHGQTFRGATVVNPFL